MKELLKTHYKRYPLIEIDDFIKLIYQSHFGPRHMMASPDEVQLKAYLEKELENSQYYLKTPLVEDIGNDYTRVSLAVINHRVLSKEQLIVLFKQSMEDSPLRNLDLMNQFKADLTLLLELIKTEFDLPYEASKERVEQYLNSGVVAIHHTKTYRLNYHPHYRVVAKRLLETKGGLKWQK